MSSFYTTVQYETRGRDYKEIGFTIVAADLAAACSIARNRVLDDRRRRVWRVRSVSAVPSIRPRVI